MRSRLIGAAAAMALTATAATAADYGGPPPYGAPPAPYTAYSWLGPYVGGNLGYQWGALSNSGADPAGISGGGQAGYLWQSGQFVFGVETDLQFSNASGTFASEGPTTQRSKSLDALSRTSVFANAKSTMRSCAFFRLMQTCLYRRCRSFFARQFGF